MTPTEHQAAIIRDLEAQLQLASERIFYLVAELAAAQAKLGVTEYATMPKP
mgnify:FL=1